MACFLSAATLWSQSSAWTCFRSSSTRGIVFCTVRHLRNKPRGKSNPGPEDSPVDSSVMSVHYPLPSFPVETVSGPFYGISVRLNKLLYRSNIPESVKTKLDNVSFVLYNQCANEVDFRLLTRELCLKDIFVAWFRLTVLHIWLVLLRLRQSLEEEEFNRVRDNLLISLWKDIDNRLRELSVEWSLRNLAGKKNFRALDAIVKESFCEFDEGIIGDDKELAGALWRCLYDFAAVEPMFLSKAVRYIRQQIYLLEGISSEKILSEGVTLWTKRRK